jgi:prolyl-tRNA synthetase
MEEKFINKKITSRAKDYSQWYLDIIEAAGLAEYGPVRGCMVIKPYGYAIWEGIQEILDEKFKATGVQNAYFPMFIPERLLKKEKDHVEGFAPEVAVVTHAGGKKLEESLIVRPTSETIMYEVFSNWIQSYRDLPLLINQWVNVVRWEMRPRLFLRTVEFLWQEGHTVHETEVEADERARQMLEIYRDFAENILAIPVIIGVKSESEKFAGAKYTYTVEAMMQDGKSLQFATSHNLGQNFSKVFNIKFLDKKSNQQYGWQTSWGLSTRTIGGIIMTHSDDKGLILPPKIASIQVIITTIFSSNNNEDQKIIIDKAEEINQILKNKNIRSQTDIRDLRPGDKYFGWEKKGVPIRIEIGPKDIINNSVILVRRDTGEKTKVLLNDIAREIDNLLEDIQSTLYSRALEYRKEKTKTVDNWDDFIKAIEGGNFVIAHWCDDGDVEAQIKEETGATVRCLPFDLKIEKGKCIKTGRPSKGRFLFAKSY